MPLEEKLEEKASESQYLSFTELGATIKAKIRGEPIFRADKNGNEACFVTLLEQESGKQVVGKYGTSLYQLLYDKIVACGGIERLQNEFHAWKREKAGHATFDRYFPVPNKKLK